MAIDEKTAEGTARPPEVTDAQVGAFWAEYRRHLPKELRLDTPPVALAAAIRAALSAARTVPAGGEADELRVELAKVIMQQDDEFQRLKSAASHYGTALHHYLESMEHAGTWDDATLKRLRQIIGPILDEMRGSTLLPSATGAGR